MLKKLFISLLILSALTADGSVNIIEYLYGNPQLCANIGLDFFIVNNDTCVNHPAVKIDSIKNDNDLNIIINPINSQSLWKSLSLRGMLFCGYDFKNDTSDFKIVSDNFKKPINMPVTGIFEYNLNYKEVKNLLLYRSDSSPPENC